MSCPTWFARITGKTGHQPIARSFAPGAAAFIARGAGDGETAVVGYYLEVEARVA